MMHSTRRDQMLEVKKLAIDTVLRAKGNRAGLGLQQRRPYFHGSC